MILKTIHDKLREAARDGRLDEVKRLVVHGANVNAKSAPHSLGETALHMACKCHEETMALAVVKFLVHEAQANVHVHSTRLGYTALHTACCHGHWEVVQFLITQAGANVHDQSCLFDETPLHEACSSGCLPVVQFLVQETDADLYAKDRHGETPLHKASFRGHLHVVKFLVHEARVNVNVPCESFGYTALHKACFHRHNQEVVKFLIQEAHANVHSKDKFDQTALDRAQKLFKNSDKASFLKPYLVSVCQQEDLPTCTTLSRKKKKKKNQWDKDGKGDSELTAPTDQDSVQSVATSLVNDVDTVSTTTTATEDNSAQTALKKKKKTKTKRKKEKEKDDKGDSGLTAPTDHNSAQMTTSSDYDSAQTDPQYAPQTSSTITLVPRNVDTMGIASRAELMSMIQECEHAIQDEIDDPLDEDKADRAEAAERLLEKHLRPLLGTNAFPSMEMFEQAIDEETKKAKTCKDRATRRTIMANIKSLEVNLVKEQQATQQIRLPQLLQADSSNLYAAMSTHGDPEIPHLSLEYIHKVTDIFNQNQIIGSGGFANVYLGRDQRHATEFAVKRFHEHVLLGPFGDTLLNQLEREVNVLSKIRHDNIVRVLGYSKNGNDSRNICIVYEYASGGSLRTVLESKKGRTHMNCHKRLEVAICVLSALKCLHDQGCSHRDLKPDNICFSEELDRTLLIDFGLAKLIDSKSYMHTCTSLIGWSDPYVAPEFKDGTVDFSEECEMYSFGFVLSHLITTKLPRPSDRPVAAQKLIRHADRNIEWNLDILRGMCKIAQDSTLHGKRTTIDESLTHLIRLQTANPPTLSTEQSNTITMTIQRETSRKGTSCEWGSCGYCKRNCDAGLGCNSFAKSHFSCNHCITEHVKKHLGEDMIYCREACCVRIPYSVGQLVKHVDNAVLAEHLMTQQQNQRRRDEVRRREEIIRQSNFIGSQVMKAINSLGATLEQLAEDELKCPMEYVMVRVQGERRKVVGMRVKNPFQLKKSYMLYFVCAYDKTRIDFGIEIQETKEWLRKVAPALRIALLSIRINLSMATSGMPLPFDEWLDKLQLDGVLTEEMLSALDDNLAETDGTLEELETNMVAALNEMTSEADRAELLRKATTVSHEAYKEMARIAQENPSFRNHMKAVRNKDGILAWVRNENVSKWRQSGGN